MSFFKKALKSIGDIHQSVGSVLTGGAIKNPYGGSSSFRSIPRPQPYSVSTYGRPQTRFAISEANRTNLAPTVDDAKADNAYKEPGGFFRSLLPSSKRASIFGSQSGMPESILAPTNVNWYDNNGSAAGGKEAYRYSFQPKANTPYVPQSTNPYENTINQPVPNATIPAFTPADNSIPAYNSNSVDGMGFGSDPSATGAFGGVTVNVPGPTTQNAPSESAPATQQPLSTSIPLSAFYNY